MAHPRTTSPLVRAACFLGVLLGLIAGAAAQEEGTPQREKDEIPTPLAFFGWSGQIPSDRWAPVNIEITNVSKPIGGHIVIEYAQDETQQARILVPFAATPDAPARVQAVAAIPGTASSVRITLQDENGRIVRSVTYGGFSLLKLPPFVYTQRSPLLVSIGRVGASDAMSQWAKALGAEALGAFDRAQLRTKPSWIDVATARCDIAQMPLSWMAYDAVTALVVSPEIVSEADPRAITAIREWVSAGGALVILGTFPGDSWQSFFPEGEPPPIRMDDLRPGKLPEEISRAQSRFEREIRSRAEEFSGIEDRPQPLPALAESAPVRGIQLTPEGQRSGWSTRWRLEEEGRPALLAEGPIGHGWIIVLGIDPARTSSVLSGRAAGAVWRDALENLGEAEIPDSQRQQMLAMGVYAPDPVQAATSAAIGRVADVPVIGGDIFALIALCIVALAILVGPADWFVLKRFRLLHRSWLTALAWTLLAGIAAYWVPLLIRTEPTQFNRIAVFDVTARPSAASEQILQTGRAQYTAVSGIYTAQSGTASFSDVNPTSWWRGVSHFNPWQGGSPGGGGVLPVLQAAAGGEAGSTRGSPVSAVPFPLWTFRTMLDQGQEQIPLSIRIGENSGQPQLVIAGLPEGALVTSAALRTSEGWHVLAGSTSAPAIERRGAAGAVVSIYPVGSHEDGMWTGRFRSTVLRTPPGEWTPGYAPYEFAAPPGYLLQLPGSVSRLVTVDRCVESGRWKCLYLLVENWPAKPTISWDARYSSAAVLRVLIPAEADENEPGEETTP